MMNTQNILTNAKDIRQALTNNCLYVYHEVNSQPHRIIGVKMVGPVDSDSRDMYVKHLSDGRWHQVIAGDRITQG